MEPNTFQAAGPAPLAGGPRWRIVMAGGEQAPDRARAWLQRAGHWLDGESERQLALLVSELVSNAVRHGGAGDADLIELELCATSRGVGVEVSDPGPGFVPRRRDLPLDEPGGWGLVLVDQLAERWGVVRDSRTRVWLELATRA